MGKILEKIKETFKKIAEFDAKYLSISESSSSYDSPSYDSSTTYSRGEKMTNIAEIIELQRRGVYAISSSPDEILRELQRREHTASGFLTEKDCRTCGYMKSYGVLFGNKVQKSCASCTYMIEARSNELSFGYSKPNPQIQIDPDELKKRIEAERNSRLESVYLLEDLADVVGDKEISRKIREIASAERRLRH